MKLFTLAAVVAIRNPDGKLPTRRSEAKTKP